MLREQMNEALKDAMRSGQTRKVATVRLMIAKLRDKDIESRPKGIDQIPDGEILSMLQGMIKQRRDSIEMYRQGKRDDLVEQELQEITVIEAFPGSGRGRLAPRLRRSLVRPGPWASKTWVR